MAGQKYAAGGIRSTVAATRAATDDELRARLRGFVDEMLAQGTTTVEIKSGYGLSVADEERLVRLAAEVTPEVTFLGAHVVPAEYADRADEYVDLVTGPMLDACAPHSKWIDVFCETGAFTVRAVATGARGRHRARASCPRVHASQLGPGDGVRLAVELGAASDRSRHLPDRRRCRRARRLRHRAHAAARRRVLDAPAVPGRASTDRCGRHRGDRVRHEPGLELHVVDAVLHRDRRARHGHDTDRGGVGGDRRGSPRAASRRRRRDRGRGRGPISCC